MSMGEVAYEIREYADILVGAEGLEPAFGWPYRSPPREGKSPRLPCGPEALASEIVEEYVTHYNDFDRPAGRSADLSAIRLSEMPELVRAFRALVDAAHYTTTAEDQEGHNKLLLAHWYAQTYKFDQFVDLTGSVHPDPETVSLVGHVRRALSCCKSTS